MFVRADAALIFLIIIKIVTKAAEVATFLHMPLAEGQKVSLFKYIRHISGVHSGLINVPRVVVPLYGWKRFHSAAWVVIICAAF